MPLLDANKLTLADWAKRTDPNGKTAGVVELLSQTNDVVKDARFIEGNLATGHQTTIRTGLPTAYWRLINQGVPNSRSTTAQVTETCAMLTARSQVDKDLAELNADLAAFRMSEAMPFIEAMNQEFAGTLFYGAASAPEEFVGLSNRYSTISTSFQISQNVLSGGGSGSDNASIYLIGWGPETVHCLFPKGSTAGLKHEDLGVQDAFDASNNRFRAYMDSWCWKVGLCLKDWRYAVRIANIDVSNLVAKSSAADLIELMIKAIHRIPSLNMCNPVFYMPRSVYQMLDIQRRDDVISGGGLSYENFGGTPVLTFRGIPVRKCDQLLETEATIS